MNPKSKTFAVLPAMFATIGLLLALVTGHAAAEFKANYTADVFETAQNENKHIVVEVFKRGCGTCKAQQPSLEAARVEYPEALFLKFDFANNDEAVKRFEVVKQSTIIVFKGQEEVARLVGETDKGKILGAIGKGV